MRFERLLWIFAEGILALSLFLSSIALQNILSIKTDKELKKSILAY